MKLQLKAIKVAHFASEETYCYEASLYVNGKRAARVSNDGHGGPDYQDFTDPAIGKAVHDHFLAMPQELLPFSCPGEDEIFIQPDLEQWCANQVSIHVEIQHAKGVAKRAAKAIFFVADTMESDCYSSFRLPYSPANRDKVEKRLAQSNRKAFVISPDFVLQHPHNWLEAAREQIPA